MGTIPKGLFATDKGQRLTFSFSICTLTFAVLIAMGQPQQPKQQPQPVSSRREIYDVKSKLRTSVKKFDKRIEAPNWTPDGKFLVYNSNGLICIIPVGGGEPEQIKTGTISVLSKCDSA